MPLDMQSKKLVACMTCGRHFEETRIKKHQDICRKSIKVKRKPFDSFKQRIRGTVLENHVDNIKARLHSQTSARMHHDNWRKAHEEFISTIKAAKRSHRTENESEESNQKCTPSVTNYSMPAL